MIHAARYGEARQPAAATWPRVDRLVQHVDARLLHPGLGPQVGARRHAAEQAQLACGPLAVDVFSHVGCFGAATMNGHARLAAQQAAPSPPDQRRHADTTVGSGGLRATQSVAKHKVNRFAELHRE
jgi:hypothetical protein